MNFGDVAIAGAFIEEKKFNDEKKYPLVIDFCENCYAVQVRDHIDPSVLFEHDYYFSSAIGSLKTHFASYAEEIISRLLEDPAKSTVVEFGSNDGVLLKPLADNGVGRVIGIDPAKNIVDSIKDHRLSLVNDFLNVKSAKRIVDNYGRADIVTGNNVFAHISDINGVTEAIYNLLTDEGVFVFEVHYLGKIIEGLQYDFIYHEHIYYYSLIALENHLARHDMVIFDLKPIPIHGGSIRYFATKKGSANSLKISESVQSLRKEEIRLGYDRSTTYKDFAKKIESRKNELMRMLSTLKAQDKKIIGYGASGRANTIIQYCGITNKIISCIVDDAPAKQGLFTPGSHIKINNPFVISEEKPDYILIFAWAFAKEIIEKNQTYMEQGAKFIIPLPEVSIIGS